MTSDMVFHTLKLLRWNNLLIVMVTQYAVAYFLIDSMIFQDLLFNPKMLALSISTIFITAAGYLINDYYDIKIDYVNKPQRVVVGRFLNRRSIIIFHATLNTLGIAGGFWVSWELGTINLLAAGLLWLYSNQLKRLPFIGNLTVAFLTGLSVVVVYILLRESIFLIGAYAVFAFYISLIREIIKDMEDVEGDKKFGCKTLPISVGVRKSKMIIYLIILLFILSVVVLLQHEPKFWWILSGLTIMLTLLGHRLYKADKNIDFTNLSKLSKQIMILGLVSLIFFR